MFKLIPKEEKFFDMFISMAQNAHEASKLLTGMMEQPEKMRDTAESIKALEHKGDRMTHDLIVKLNKTFIVPIDREDIYGLSSKLDDVTDLEPVVEPVRESALRDSGGGHPHRLAGSGSSSRGILMAA